MPLFTQDYMLLIWELLLEGLATQRLEPKDKSIQKVQKVVTLNSYVCIWPSPVNRPDLHIYPPSELSDMLLCVFTIKCLVVVGLLVYFGLVWLACLFVLFCFHFPLKIFILWSVRQKRHKVLPGVGWWPTTCQLDSQMNISLVSCEEESTEEQPQVSELALWTLSRKNLNG